MVVIMMVKVYDHVSSEKNPKKILEWYSHILFFGQAGIILEIFCCMVANFHPPYLSRLINP